MANPAYRAPVARCPKCHGLLIASADLEPATRAVETVAIEWRRLPSEAVQLEPCCCPACGPDEQAMSKLTHPREREVTMDFCAGCGAIWLDAGELAAIRRQGLFAALKARGARRATLAPAAEQPPAPRKRRWPPPAGGYRRVTLCPRPARVAAIPPTT